MWTDTQITVTCYSPGSGWMPAAWILWKRRTRDCTSREPWCTGFHRLAYFGTRVANCLFTAFSQHHQTASPISYETPLEFWAASAHNKSWLEGCFWFEMARLKSVNRSALNNAGCSYYHTLWKIIQIAPRIQDSRLHNDISNNCITINFLLSSGYFIRSSISILGNKY